MDWVNERYVRVYTRDTAEWLSLSLEAQALFVLVLRKVDRSGVMDLGKLGRRGVAVAIGHGARWQTIEPALAELETDGCVEIGGTSLVVPNFLAAQEAVMSDALRQRVARERRRDAASVTKRDEASRNVTAESRNVARTSRAVTPRHAASRAVTPSVPSVPSVPSQKEIHVELDSTSVPPETAPKITSADVRRVFGHWQAAMGHPKARLDGKRERVIRSAIGLYDVATCLRAIDGCAASAYHMGDNATGTRYDGIELILRDAAHVERFVAMAESPPTPRSDGGARVLEMGPPKIPAGVLPRSEIARLAKLASLPPRLPLDVPAESVPAVASEERGT